MIYIVTQDGLNNYPVEDEDIIKTLVTTGKWDEGHCKYHITLERTFNALSDKPCVTLGDYVKEESAIKVIKEIANRRALCVHIEPDDGWNSCYFMPKEDEDGEKN